MTEPRGVGPVLLKSARSEPVLAALRRRNPQVRFVDRGAYVRVLNDSVCELWRSDVESESGCPFRLPGDLELLMPSFSGVLQFAGNVVRWTERR